MDIIVLSRLKVAKLRKKLQQDAFMAYLHRVQDRGLGKVQKSKECTNRKKKEMWFQGELKRKEKIEKKRWEKGKKKKNRGYVRK